MADLSDWGAITEPRLQKRSSVQLGDRTVGYFGYDTERDERCYLSIRNSEEHRYHGEDPWYDFPFEGDGHGLSVELFNRIHGSNVGRIYIIEEDTGDIYQYGFQQFVDGVPINFEDEAEGRGYEKDPQKVVGLVEAVEVYEDAYPGVFVQTAGFR